MAIIIIREWHTHNYYSTVSLPHVCVIYYCKLYGRRVCEYSLFRYYDGYYFVWAEGDKASQQLVETVRHTHSLS